MDATSVPLAVGSVASCHRHPVKSMQGIVVDHLEVDRTGVDGDRSAGVVDVETGHLLSAKLVPDLLWATGRDDAIELPDGTAVGREDPDVDQRLSAWLDRKVRLVHAGAQPDLAYEMTFDPTDDTAEAFEIPVPPGTLLDLTPVHLVARATLEACASARPDVDWDVRRFRPNLVLDLDAPAWAEQSWIGRRVEVGSAVLEITGPMVRCAMPLRAQPADGDGHALERQVDVYRALSELNVELPNHLGLCLDVVEPGRIETGDEVGVV